MPRRSSAVTTLWRVSAGTLIFCSTHALSSGTPTPAAQIREHERPVAAHLAGVALHHFERRAHVRRKIDLVDHQQIRAHDARAALARNLVAARHVDHVDRNVHQFRAERRGQIVAAAFDEDQFQARMRALQILRSLPGSWTHLRGWRRAGSRRFRRRARVPAGSVP